MNDGVESRLAYDDGEEAFLETTLVLNGGGAFSERVLEVVGGMGQFEGATGRITSNFVLSDTGDLKDNQFGLVFLGRQAVRDGRA